MNQDGKWWMQFGVQYAQGHLDTWTVGARDRSTNAPSDRPPELYQLSSVSRPSNK